MSKCLDQHVWFKAGVDRGFLFFWTSRLGEAPRAPRRRFANGACRRASARRHGGHRCRHSQPSDRNPALTSDQTKVDSLVVSHRPGLAGVQEKNMRLGRWNLLITILPGIAILGVVLCLCAPAIGQSQPAQSKPAQDAIANSLPSTNLSTDGPVDNHVPAPAPGFASATVANNPLAPEARAVGEKTCIACHRLEADHFTHTFHALGLHVANRSDPRIPVCEACHGPGSQHAANPLAPGLIIAYTKNQGYAGRCTDEDLPELSCGWSPRSLARFRASA